MKQNKQLIKIYVPILLFFIGLFSIHFKQGVDTYIQKDIQRINNTRGMYDISLACDNYAFEGKEITNESAEFLQLYENWDVDYIHDGYSYKTIFNQDFEIKNFDIISYRDFDAEIKIVTIKEAEGYEVRTVDLSLLDDSQKEKVETILKENYQQKIIIEVQGERGLDGAMENSLNGEIDYVYERIIANYLKINDTVIIGSKPDTVFTGGVIEYYDENMYLTNGYDYSEETENSEVYGRYANIKKTRNDFLNLIKNEWDINGSGFSGSNIREIGGDYYIINVTSVSLNNYYKPDYLATITVLPDLRSTMESQFINDNMLLYIGFAFVFITSILVTKYKVLQPTKNVLEKIKEIENEYNIESTTDNTLKESVLQLDQVKETIKDKILSLENQMTTLRHELEEYNPKEAIEKQDNNELEEIVDSIISKYTMLLNNKRIEILKDITINQTRYNKEDLEYLFTQVCNRVVYQVAIQGNIKISMNTKEISIQYTSNTKIAQNNITIDKSVKELLEKYQSAYKIEENDKEVSIIFSC